MTAPTTHTAGQISPDGQHQWNGSAWVPNPNLPKAKKKHTVRNIFLGLIALFILLFAGCAALVGGAANEVSKSIEENDNKAGGANNPMEITAGEAFEVDGFNYAAGWSVGKDALDDTEVTGLKVTNNREDRDSALVEIKFMKGTEVVASVDCTSDPIAVGTTVTLNCFSADDFPASYDKITINDSF